MKTFVILRGLPASGKSTFVKDSPLENYTVSSDKLRRLCGGMNLDLTGKFKENQECNQAVFSVLGTILESRFKHGAFTIYDATNLKREYLTSLKKQAKSYGYRIFIVDFTDVSVETCIARDKRRPVEEQVGAHVIQRMSKYLEDTVPSGMKVIKPNEFVGEVLYRTHNLDGYDAVHHIGDLHGCYSVLEDYLEKQVPLGEEYLLNPKHFFIFLGDYVDRGTENAKVIKFLDCIKDFPNVLLLEGNHEKNLERYVDVNTGVTETLVKGLQKKLCPCFKYTFRDKTVFCSHGGVSNAKVNPIFINTKQLLKGVGEYEEVLDNAMSFKESSQRLIGESVYQVHGHRNAELCTIEMNEFCFNLCDEVETGGYLRCLILDDNGFTPVLTENIVFDKQLSNTFHTVSDMLETLEASPLVRSKKQRGMNVTSFNFTRQAFKGKVWNNTTIKARGLFINTETEEIVVRGYDKFFNLGESPETKDLDGLQFPLRCYEKSDGFLGLMGYDKQSDRVLYCSKSESAGEHSEYFRKLMKQKTHAKELEEYVKGSGCTLLFEVIDVENDPHIIEYSNSKVILLDVVNNSIEFSNYSYDFVKSIANQYGLDYKKQVFEALDLEGLKALVEYGGDILGDCEGLVMEDASGFMFKFKTSYFNYWKHNRTSIARLRKGGTVTETDLANDFVVWVQDKPELWDVDIIKLRQLFLQEVDKSTNISC